ncbi:MAG: helix-turn-helix transcriptional regulator [Parcubacteria group bacterium]|nr:helix-turn-helix transcriptional regulator [Parcubacteria group bacterium]
MKRAYPQEDIERLNIILENIDRHRKTHGVLKKTMHAKTGIPRQSMHKYRSGTAFPLLYPMESWARYFEVHFVEILLSHKEMASMISHLLATYSKDVAVSKHTNSTAIWHPSFLLSVPSNIKRRRKELRLTLRDVEELMGGETTSTSLSRYERGAPLNTRIIIPLSEVLETTTLELMTPKKHVASIVAMLGEKYAIQAGI